MSRDLHQILALSIPAIVANIAMPLMSMCDMGIAGRLGGADVLGAVALGGVIFNLLYWLLGFLRMGTSGLTAQRYGAADRRGELLILDRSLIIAISIGALMLVLQRPLLSVLIGIMDSTDEVAALAWRYCRVCIWGAPAVLSTTAFTGWYVGLQNSRLPMVVSVSSIALNAVVSIVLVFVFGFGIEGVAAGTVTAQYYSAAFFFVRSRRRLLEMMIPLAELLDWPTLSKFFKVNVDIFFRTLCMVAVTYWFTRQGASQGDVVLAANALIMQCFTLFSYFMDGFAYAAEGLCGKYFGANNMARLKKIVRTLMRVGLTLSLIFGVLYLTAGDELFRFLSEDMSVRAKAHEYLWWGATVPLAGFGAFIADGVAVGVTRTRDMLWSLVLATIVFFAVLILSEQSLGNHGLWLAFVCYLAVRGIFLAGRLNVMIQKSTPA